MNDDLVLLRQYEPIVRYTYGEHFFPIDVDRYVARSGLWLQPSYGSAKEIVPRGLLHLNQLAGLLPDESRGQQFLYFVKPLTGRALQRFLRQRDRAHLRVRGRLARVGLLARMVDGLFTMTLLLRGTVPGGTAAAAEKAYREMQASAERYTYYGRVIRQDGYVILHYLYFYCMNDWRSSFHGVNDHEGDWEQVFVYLEDCPGQPLRPAWVAYASHDYSGDDLRRHWDDPQVEKSGNHPIIYAGAGSHASYFTRGEYLITVSLEAFRPVIHVLEAVQRFWRVTLRQGDPDAPPVDIARLFRIPFVEYARGDGLSIGPGGDKSWSPVLLDPVPGWVSEYRGLWGFYAKDPVSGENAPAGPKFTRSGTIRRSWHNPLGFAGLQKVGPPGCTEDILRVQIEQLQAEQNRDRATSGAQHEQLARLYAQMRALADQPHLKEAYTATWADVQEREQALNRLSDTIAQRDEILRACEQRLARVEAGDTGPIRDHIRHTREPQSEEEIRTSGLAEGWAAFSVGLLLVGFVLVYVITTHWIAGLGVMIAVFFLIEAAFRQELENLTVRMTMGLSVVATLILIYDFFWEIIIAGVMATGLLIIVDNLRELHD